MQVMFMCGGKGRRLQSSHSGPKSLTPIGGSTLLARLILQFGPLHTSAKPPVVVVDQADRRTPRAVRMLLPQAEVVGQPQPDGVASALLAAAPLLDDVSLVVLGDMFFAGRFAPFPRRPSLVYWCGASPADTRKNFAIATDPDGVVHAVTEKPIDTEGMRCGVGVYVLTPEVVACFAAAPVDARGERGITSGIAAALACGLRFQQASFHGFYGNVNCGADLAAIERYRHAGAG
jgi:dTDP-glucose pyrophosphorylase